MSGYESLEAVNILSEPPIIRNSSIKMAQFENGGKSTSIVKQEDRKESVSLGLVNPHYSGPSVDESEEERHAR